MIEKPDIFDFIGLLTEEEAVLLEKRIKEAKMRRQMDRRA